MKLEAIRPPVSRQPRRARDPASGDGDPPDHLVCVRSGKIHREVFIEEGNRTLRVSVVDVK